MSRDPGIEHTLFDVPRHLLGADQHAFDFRIVDLRIIRSRRKLDGVSGLLEEFCRRVLEATGRNS